MRVYRVKEASGFAEAGAARRNGMLPHATGWHVRVPLSVSLSSRSILLWQRGLVPLPFYFMGTLLTASRSPYLISSYTAGDEEGVAAVAASVHFDRQPPEDRSRTGYLVRMWSTTEYRRRLLLCSCTRLAKQEGSVVGFLLAYHRAALEQMRQEGLSDPLIEKALQDSVEQVFLVDQIAVELASAGLGVAGRLYDSFQEATCGGIGYASIMHAPVRNKRSRGFFTQRNHWQEVGSYRTELHEWGIYRGVL